MIFDRILTNLCRVQNYMLCYERGKHFKSAPQSLCFCYCFEGFTKFSFNSHTYTVTDFGLLNLKQGKHKKISNLLFAFLLLFFRIIFINKDNYYCKGYFFESK